MVKVQFPAEKYLHRQLAVDCKLFSLSNNIVQHSLPKPEKDMGGKHLP